MSKVRNHKGRRGNTTTIHSKSKGFSRNITLIAAKRAEQGEHLNHLEYKDLLQKHAAAIAYISEKEEREFDLMIRDLQLLKAGKL